jgi:hypothetical protein
MSAGMRTHGSVCSSERVLTFSFGGFVNLFFSAVAARIMCLPTTCSEGFAEQQTRTSRCGVDVPGLSRSGSIFKEEKKKKKGNSQETSGHK